MKYNHISWIGIPILLILVVIGGYHAAHPAPSNTDSIRSLLEGDSAILNHSQIPEPDTSAVTVDSSMMLTTDVKEPLGYISADRDNRVIDSVYDGQYFVMNYKRVPPLGFMVDTLAFQNDPTEVLVQYRIVYNRRLVLKTLFTQPPKKMDSVDWVFEFHPENLKK